MRNLNDFGREKLIKKIGVFITTLCIVMAFSTPVFAEANYGQNVGTWITEQAFWIGLAAVVIVLIPMILRKAWVPVVTTSIIAAIVLVIIKSPERLVRIGEALFSILE